ncbi:MAG: hypothetical protein ABIN96_13390 [Rubrivivax sp.]
MAPNDPKQADPKPTEPAEVDDESPLESLGEAISESVLGAKDGKPVPPAKPLPDDRTPPAPGKPGESRQPR